MIISVKHPKLKRMWECGIGLWFWATPLMKSFEKNLMTQYVWFQNQMKWTVLCQIKTKDFESMEEPCLKPKKLFVASQENPRGKSHKIKMSKNQSHFAKTGTFSSYLWIGVCLPLKILHKYNKWSFKAFGTFWMKILVYDFIGLSIS